MASRKAPTVRPNSKYQGGAYDRSKSWRAKISVAGPAVVFHSFSTHVRCASKLRHKCWRNSQRLWPPSGQKKRKYRPTRSIRNVDTDYIFNCYLLKIVMIRECHKRHPI